MTLQIIIPPQGKRALSFLKPKVEAFTDTISFTFSAEYYGFSEEDDSLRDLRSLAYGLSYDLKNILGYGLVEEQRVPLRHYKCTYRMGIEDIECNWGMACMGGYSQRNTILVHIYGQGCAAAAKEWEQRLFDWMQKLPDLTLTRIDLAIDTENYSMEQAKHDWETGKFSLKKHAPKHYLVNYENPEEGRTLYVGSPSTGKRARIYEKGKQLGDPYSKLIRVETEWRNKHRVLPQEMLIEPTRYLAGAYPATADIIKNANPLSVPTKVKAVEITYGEMVRIIKHQFGTYIYAMRQIENSPEDIVKKLSRKPHNRTGIPERLLLPHWCAQTAKIKTKEILNGEQTDWIDMITNKDNYQ